MFKTGTSLFLKPLVSTKDFPNLINKGIYKVYFEDSPNIFYLGSTHSKNTNFYLRWKEHLWNLLRKRHHSYKLQDAFDEKGITGLKFEIVKIFSNDFISKVVRKEEEDLIKLFNCVDRGYNISYDTTSPMTGRKNKSIMKKVSIYDLNGDLVKHCESVTEAAEILNISTGEVSYCCQHTGGIRQLRGFQFRYFTGQNKIEKYYKQIKLIDVYTKEGVFIETINSLEELKEKYRFNKDSVRESLKGICRLLKHKFYVVKHGEKIEPPNYKHKRKKVFQYDKKGNFIREWNSMIDIERELNISNSNISKVLDLYYMKKGIVKYYTLGGFIWKSS